MYTKAKMDRITDPVEGNIPIIDSIGNIKDSGYSLEGLFDTFDAMIYKGSIAGVSDSTAYGGFTPKANKGWVYMVSSAGKINGVSCSVGDVLICNTDKTAASTETNYLSTVSKWDYYHHTNYDTAIASLTARVEALEGNS